MTDLVFGAGRAPDANLVFGQEDAGVVRTPVTLDVATSLGGVSVAAFMAPPRKVEAATTLGGVAVSAFVVTPVRLEASATLGGVTVSAGMIYDIRVINWLDTRALTEHNSASTGLCHLSSDWNLSNTQRGGRNSAWQLGHGREVLAVGASQVAITGRDVTDIPWVTASATRVESSGLFETGVPKRESRTPTYQVGVFRNAESESRMQAGIFKVLPKVSTHQVAGHARRLYDMLVGASMYRAGKQFTDSLFQMAGSPLPGFDPFEPLPPVPETWGANLVFQCPVLGYPALVFGALPCYPETPQPQATVVIQIKRAYIVINNASLRRVDGNIQLPTFGMSLSLDTDSWTWGFSASLPAETLSNLEPTSTGAPVEVEAMINGVPYRALVESISRSRSFGKSTISIQGRGKTALLDVPYSPVSNFTNTLSRTAQQIMGDILSVNGVPMGWAINWGLTDWLVPAGVFTHQGSYIGALGRIAESVGGYLQPHASTQTINVLPRYPSTPWTWGLVNPDFELPSSVTTTEGITWAEKARYNRVFVSGVQEGVLGQVTRTGTAGDLVAPMVTDALITHVDAARQRGLTILANTGRQANVTLKLPVLAETGIITPGKFVRYVDGATTRTGIVRSVGVEIGMPDIFQTLGIEAHVN